MQLRLWQPTSCKADEFIGHRLRLYANPTGDVDGYLKSQKGGSNKGYVKPGTK